MKKYKTTATLLLFVPIVLFSLYFYSGRKRNSAPIDKKQVPQTQNDNTVTKDVNRTSIDGFEISWVKLDRLANLALYSNTETKLTSKEAQEKYGCKILISAGFYDKQDKHLGLFKNHQGTISRYQKNDTFNGFLQIKKDYTLSISSRPLNESLISLQTGPILMEKGVYLPVVIRNDKDARRIVAARTNEGNLIFIVFYQKGSVFSGPKLQDLQDIIQKLNQKKLVEITDAINLDGGTHSVFVDENLTLPESANVGGFFCVKNSVNRNNL